MLDFYRSLIDDRVRTNAYREALQRTVKPGDVVVDLGSGTGILALLALEAGARRVFAIEKSHAADALRFLVRRLGHADRIEVLHEQSTKVGISEPADVLVTETMGMFGFDQPIVGAVLDARKRLLRPDAPAIPQRSDRSI